MYRNNLNFITSTKDLYKYKKVLVVPGCVKVFIEDGSVSIRGSLGKLTHILNKFVCVKLIDSEYLNIYSKCSGTNVKCLIGTTYSLINGMIKGVTLGFVKRLQLVGIGYRVVIENDNVLNFMIGLSHPVYYRLPEGITAQCINQIEIVLKGINKQLVGQVAADLRAIRPPEPFKGKGIRYLNELIYHKETKKK